MNLTDKQLKWLITHFKHTKNADVAAHLGISQSSVARLAREHGLRKSTQFLHRCQREAAELARKANLLRVVPEDFRIPGGERHQFKPGVSNVMRLGAKKEARRIEAVRQARNATIRRERARMAFGLPQRTCLRLVRQPTPKVQLRWYLRKRGYIVDDERRCAFYTENTHRGKRVEAREQPWYKFRPYETQKSPD